MQTEFRRESSLGYTLILSFLAKKPDETLKNLSWGLLRAHTISYRLAEPVQEILAIWANNEDKPGSPYVFNVAQPFWIAGLRFAPVRGLC